VVSHSFGTPLGTGGYVDPRRLKTRRELDELIREHASDHAECLAFVKALVAHHAKKEQEERTAMRVGLVVLGAIVAAGVYFFFLR
jgi:hypothetical protein